MQNITSRVNCVNHMNTRVIARSPPPILNVSRDPRKRIGYCTAFESSTNCSIITISRCTPDTQRWRSAVAKGEARANVGSKLKFNGSGARNLSEGAATRHRAGIAGCN